MSSEREILAGAIKHIREHGPFEPLVSLSMCRVLAAAESHLTTLPRTKMVEQFRVEFAQTNPSAKGKWHAASAAFNDRAAADAYAQVVRSWDNTACVYVTGPHMQEVPA